MKKLIVKIDRKEFENKLEAAKNFSWTGWEMPVFIEEYDSHKKIEEAAKEKDEIVTTIGYGAWRNNGYLPNVIELRGIVSWEYDEEESCIEEEINRLTDYYVEMIEEDEALNEIFDIIEVEFN
jgi:hypothetical protein